MRHLSLFSYLCLTATATTAEAAGPEPGYLQRHAETRGFMLGRPVKPHPTPDGRSVLFLRATARVPELRLYEFDVATAQTREVLTPQLLLRGAEEHLSKEEQAHRERMRVSLRGFTWFDLSKDGGLILLSLSGRLYTVDRRDHKVTELRTGSSQSPVLDPQLSPDGKKVAYVRDHDLYVLELASQHERRMTRTGSPTLQNGLAEFVAQEEMRRYSGFLWAPDSRGLVYEESDTSGVEVFHIMDATHPEAEVQAVPYPRPGKANARVRLGMIQVDGEQTNQPTWIAWDHEHYPYLCTMRWQENAPLTLVLMDRHQRDLEVAEVDPRTGRTRPLLHEHDDAWLNLDQDMPRWLRDGSAFLWTSERSGGWELELRDRHGARQSVLVHKEAGYQGLVDVDEESGQVVMAASREPSEHRLWRVPLRPAPGQDASPQPLSQGPGMGMYQAVFSKDHRVYVQTSATLSSMPLTTVHRSDGTLLGELPAVAEALPFRPAVEITQVGTQAIRAAIVRPRGFSPGRKYPVVVNVYGGPAHLQVTAAMSPWLLPQWIADHGFIVVAFDGRGTPGRGRSWERAIHGNFAQVTLSDQVTALQELGHRVPEMDLSRVGIYGWSFGGYMAALAVLRRPDVYKVGVAGAPVVDWHDYDTFYTERYLDLPQDNAAGYEDSSLLTHAPGLSRPLLLIHGTADDNVYFFHSLKLSQALFRAGRHHEFLPLSGLTHMVPEAVTTQRLWGRIVDMLSATLKP